MAVEVKHLAPPRELWRTGCKNLCHPIKDKKLYNTCHFPCGSYGMMVGGKLLAPPLKLRRTGYENLCHRKPIARGKTAGVVRSGLGWVQATSRYDKEQMNNHGVKMGKAHRGNI